MEDKVASYRSFPAHLLVADVALKKSEIIFIKEGLYIPEIPCAQVVEADHLILLLQEVLHHVRPDKTGAAGDQDSNVTEFCNFGCQLRGDLYLLAGAGCRIRGAGILLFPRIPYPESRIINSKRFIDDSAQYMPDQDVHLLYACSVVGGDDEVDVAERAHVAAALAA